jgi:hypothetical protein
MKREEFRLVLLITHLRAWLRQAKEALKREATADTTDKTDWEAHVPSRVCLSALAEANFVFLFRSPARRRLIEAKDPPDSLSNTLGVSAQMDQRVHK